MNRRRIPLYLELLASAVIQIVLLSFFDQQGGVVVGSLFLLVVARLFFVQGFYTLYQRTRSLNVRRFLVRVTRRRGEGAYIDGAGESTLFGNLVIVFLFFWPFAFAGLAALLEQTYPTLLMWSVFTVQQLLARDIHMEFGDDIRKNFGYNLRWMFSLVLVIPVGIVVFALAYLVSLLGLFAMDNHAVGSFAMVLTLHGISAVFRSDKENFDWSGSPDGPATER